MCFLATDIVGCGVDFSLGRAFYTKNGAFLGKCLARLTFTIADEYFESLRSCF